MEYYIKFENNASVGHPQALENLQQVHENFLETHQSLGYYPIEVIPTPHIAGRDRTLIAAPTYSLDGNTASMSYIIRKMTNDEKVSKYNELLSLGSLKTGWILNSENLEWEPPFPEPADGNVYLWDNLEQNWIVDTPEA
jgi:hypothetical protein